jgi:hypothetical protein
VTLRVKAIYRGRAIATPGKNVYRPSQRKVWLAKLASAGARARAASLLEQLDKLLELKLKARAAMIADARRQPGWKILRSIPFLGPIRTAQLLAIIATPHRFRTKRQLWPYAGFGVVQRTSAEQEIVDGKIRRRKRAPLTRGLNRNHKPGSEERLQRRRQSCSGEGGAIEGNLRPLCGRRRSGRDGETDAGAENHIDRATSVEERRALGSEESDDASDIALGTSRRRVRVTHSTRRGSETKGSEESLIHQSLARQSVTSRHSPNCSPLRMTRRSVSPRSPKRVRVSDRTMVDTIE